MYKKYMFLMMLCFAPFATAKISSSSYDPNPTDYATQHKDHIKNYTLLVALVEHLALSSIMEKADKKGIDLENAIQDSNFVLICLNAMNYSGVLRKDLYPIIIRIGNNEYCLTCTKNVGYKWTLLPKQTWALGAPTK